ncbi:TIGR01777 family oxidoreductase [Paenibacillus radicis (ex Gao et al. 2016)]|uniref:Epimerase family protein YfhF n=1 Tax=Paenibacillus radicis (ex Gao et al. 2016) TaxID=1737354 RepID=A0A917M3D0_9BACL|nr:TIGR01777 family oxidoreductase [Paenibacillus radicis (ex Gao et al. 2016)]GGG76646.1 epimerase family protein YfhF [Paenibacillus radicis (ex Gao et al. 2016)]
MRVAITGGTGFVGTALVKALLERQDEVWIISRTAKTPGAQTAKGLYYTTWTELAEQPSKLEGVQAIVNLAGESINQRWTAAAKQRVLESRLHATARVARIVQELKQKPEVVVNASGISAYGSSLSETFDESSPMNTTDFLSGVVRQWEKAANAIEVERLVKLRVGVVLNKKGGAFPLMALPYKLYGGGPIGSGKQWLSWIHLEDMIRLILFCLDNRGVQGPVNGSAPEPVTNEDFGRALGKAFHKPHWFPVPAFLMKTVLGEMSSLLLDGQRAIPRKALELGFQFRYPDVDSAMKELAGS